jgi:30S ribosomal protein S31
MGRGDKRTKKGKIFAGSYGNSRPRPNTPAFVATEKVEKAEKKAAPKKKTATAKKKTTAKKKD